MFLFKGNKTQEHRFLFIYFLYLVFTSTTNYKPQRYSSSFRVGSKKSSDPHIYFSTIISFKYYFNQPVFGVYNVPGTVRNRKERAMSLSSKGLVFIRGEEVLAITKNN